jgi:hypothetical protein
MTDAYDLLTVRRFCHLVHNRAGHDARHAVTQETLPA